MYSTAIHNGFVVGAEQSTSTASWYEVGSQWRYESRSSVSLSVQIDLFLHATSAKQYAGIPIAGSELACL